MIEFSDITLSESGGGFIRTKEIMNSPQWMIESDMTVITDFIASSFLIHAWSTGRFEIMKTDRPCRINDIPDDDIKELNIWCPKNQWDGPYVHKSLVSDLQNFEFWMRFFRAGMIRSEALQEYEEEETERLK